MVLQYANDGDLRSYLKDYFSELKWLDKLKMAKGIASGLKYLHGENVVHRDLYDKNVLVHSGRPMIADFGLAKSSDNISDTKSFDLVYGVPAYRDPKYLADINNYKRREPSDIYSLGVLFWELTSGKPPFENMNFVTIGHVIEGRRETPINGTPADFVKLYEEAWHDDPQKRPTIEKICFKLDNQLYSKQISRDLNSLFHYNCPLEDRPKFIVRVFKNLFQDENFAALWSGVWGFFSQGLEIMNMEKVVVRLEESRKESVDADKVVKFACFLAAAVFEIAVVIANFYFQDVFGVFLSCVFLNCPSAFIIFAAATRNKNTVMAFSAEGIVVALKVFYMNVFFGVILFAVANVVFVCFCVFDVNYEDVHNFVTYVSNGLKAFVKIFNSIFINFVKFSNASFAVSNLIQN
ncbi:kinase-like protein [Gigaspora margarita]|nr:kinase-like protein [Gigaspora margarita]